MNSRREFALQMVLATSAAASPRWLAGVVPGPTRIRETWQVTLDRMVPWLHARFRVRGAPGSRDLELVQARALPRHRPGSGEKFALVFRGAPTDLLPQDVYLFEHPVAGRFELCLVPVVTSREGAQHYEAIINREVPA